MLCMFRQYLQCNVHFKGCTYKYYKYFYLKGVLYVHNLYPSRVRCKHLLFMGEWCQTALVSSMPVLQWFISYLDKPTQSIPPPHVSQSLWLTQQARGYGPAQGPHWRVWRKLMSSHPSVLLLCNHPGHSYIADRSLEGATEIIACTNVGDLPRWIHFYQWPTALRYQQVLQWLSCRHHD